MCCYGALLLLYDSMGIPANPSKIEDYFLFKLALLVDLKPLLRLVSIPPPELSIQRSEYYS